MYNHPPYHFSSSKECGTRLSGHQPSIAVRDGREAKFVQVNECTNNTQDSRGLHPIMHNQKGRRPRNEARFITLSMKRPTFLVFGLTSDPNTCNATHMQTTCLSINDREVCARLYHVSNACKTMLRDQEH